MPLSQETARQAGINLINEHGGKVPKSHSMRERIEEVLGDDCWELLLSIARLTQDIPIQNEK